MKSILSPLLLIAALALSGGRAHADKADRNKPMNVEADSLRYDDTKKISVFTGGVVLTKGSIVIRGSKVEVRQDAEGYQFGLVTSEPGKLASFRQKRDGLDEYIEGEGETIEYDSRADTVKFVKKAQLRRLQGAKVNDEMSGAVIFYNNTTDVFTIDGSVAKATPGAPAGRVRVMLTPKADPNAPAANGATPAPALRASPTLEGEKK